MLKILSYAQKTFFLHINEETLALSHLRNEPVFSMYNLLLTGNFMSVSHLNSSLSFTDLLESVKLIFITKAFDLIKVKLFNKNRSLPLLLCWAHCRSHEETIQQVTNLQVDLCQS